VAAELGDRIAAAVPVGGAMHLENFRPVRPVPLLHIHSVDDPRALYHGGEGPPFPGTNRTVVHLPVEEGLAAWRRVNGCSGPTATVETRDGGARGPNAGQSAALLRWGSCTSGAPVEHWRLTGSGHGWPGQTRSVMRTAIVGPPTTLVNAAEEVWQFARRYSLP
jgi:polyhydroxybutyrate depolymerase